MNPTLFFSFEKCIMKLNVKQAAHMHCNCNFFNETKRTATKFEGLGKKRRKILTV